MSDELLQAARAAHAAGDLSRAGALYRELLAARPNDPTVLHGLAVLAQQVGHAGPAMTLMGRAAQLAPHDPAVQHDWGTMLALAARRAEAIAAYRQALAVDAKNAETHANLGTLLLAGDALGEAINHFETALRERPNHAVAQHNLANALTGQGRHAAALTAYARAIELEPANPEPPQNRLFTMLCADGVTPDELASAHRAWGERFAPPRAHPAFTNPPDPSRRLRVAYLSPDLRRHSVACFIESLLASHDRAAVEVVCYADVAVPDDVTERLRRLADSFHPVARLRDGELAKLVRGHAIDVLVDLAGHTRHNRLRLFAERLAPVQITYLGYPHSTGLTCMDARITDTICDPAGTEAWHTEHLERVATPFLCYAPPPEAPPVSPPPATRHNPITLGCFCHSAKISAATLDLWTRVMLETPATQLLLKSRGFADAATRDHFLREFTARGIAAPRVRLLPPAATTAEHLAAYGNIDISLDTFPYHGTTTTCEALWMGVPVVTLRGQTHHARVGAALLQAVGLAHLTAATPEQFVQITQDLTHDRTALATLRSTLRERLRTSPLCDGPRLAREIEAAYRRAWTRWCATQ